MSTTPTTISIDGQDYVRADSVSKASGEVRIVILQRGWNVVGRYVEDGDEVTITDASVIRVWGTSKGLGQLVDGPTSSTKLDTQPAAIARTRAAELVTA